MAHSTIRAIRRQNVKRTKSLELWSSVKELERLDVPASLDGIHSGHGAAARVCVQTVVAGGRVNPQVIRTFIHPTKKATRGRIATLKHRPIEQEDA